jgi:Flp pilus assembly pilin Flp
MSDAILRLIVRLQQDRRAVTALEYGVIAGTIILGITTVLGTVKSDLVTEFTSIAGAL